MLKGRVIKSCQSHGIVFCIYSEAFISDISGINAALELEAEIFSPHGPPISG